MRLFNWHAAASLLPFCCCAAAGFYSPLSSGYLLTCGHDVFWHLALSFHSTWQSKRYLLTLIGAVVVSLPLLILYPLVLSKTNPEWFDIWFNHYSLGVFGGFHQIQTASACPII